LGELAALAAALCWAGGFVALRGIAGSFPSLQLNAIRLWAPAVMMPAGMFAFGLHGEFLKLEWHNFAAMAGSVVLGIGLGDTLLFGIMRLIGVTRSYTIGATAPMFGLVYAAVLLGEDFAPLAVFGTGIIIAGGILVTVHRASGDGDSITSGRAYWRAVVIAVGIAMMWGLDFTLLKIGIGDLPPVVANSFRMPAAALAIGLVAWKSAGRIIPRAMTHRDRAVAVLSGAVGLGAGSMFFLTAIQTLGAGRAGAIGAVSPVFAMMLAAVFLRERPGWLTVVGTFLAVAGVTVLSLI
jgi:drug/metabolite transporter (DMT)-like permease